MQTWLKNNWKALIVFAIGAAFLILGICRGEVTAILAKATRVCMQCIGLG